MTIDELVEELRLQGVTDLTQVQYAILETNGDLSVLLRPEFQPVTPSHLGQTPAAESLPLVLINDGRVLSENLHALGLEERWLQRTLREQGASSPREVFLLTADRDGKLYFAAKEGRT